MAASSTQRGWLPVALALTAAGWAANQFTPLSVVYRTELHWGTVAVVGMFTIYLVGLVPALLLGVRFAARWGSRRVVRSAVALAAVSSALMATATMAEGVVYVSRLGTGVAVGLILSAAAGWLQALFADAGEPSGARGVYAIGAGFALGPIAAGVMAEWLPDPTVVPCLVHAVLCVLAFVGMRGTHDPGVATTAHVVGPELGRERWETVTHPRFVGVVLPASPAVFAAVTVAYVVLPPLVIGQVATYAPLFSGVVAAVTLTVGLAVQPLAERLDRQGSARATLIAMVTIVIGLLVGAAAADRLSPVLVVVAAVILGAGYGLTLVSGLREIERLASPATLPTASAFYQGVAHSGFLTPLLLALTAGVASYPRLLVGMAAVGVLFLAVTAVYSRRDRDRDDDTTRAGETVGRPTETDPGNEVDPNRRIPWDE